METRFYTTLEKALEAMDEFGQYFIVTLDRLSPNLYALKLQRIEEI